MNELEFNVKAIAALKKLSIQELAEKTGLNYNHLREVSAGRVKLNLQDVKILSEFSGVPADQIVD